MAEQSTIEWTDATWNPITGCSVISPGCTNCYAMKLAGGRMQHHPSRQGLTTPSKAGPVWNGQVRLNEEWLEEPLRWTRPRRIFVCAHGDLFHEAVPDDWIDRVFAIMALASHHTFQVLTKRPDRMRRYFAGIPEMPNEPAARDALIEGEAQALEHKRTGQDPSLWLAVHMPLPNVWLGTSAEDQERAVQRIPHLLATPAAVRFLSAEPLLGAIDLDVADKGSSCLERECWGDCRGCADGRPPCKGCRKAHDERQWVAGLDWVIVGGESGPSARPMHPEWARLLRDQCAETGTPFFFKQWGEWTPGENAGAIDGPQVGAWELVDGWHIQRLSKRASEDLTADSEPDVWRVGKKAAGRRLDGVEHNAMPEVRHG